MRLLQGHVTRSAPGHGIQAVPCRGLMSSGAEKVLGTRTQIDVGESCMSYLDTAMFSPQNGKTVLFLHGNPTSAYLWRNIIPHVMGVARCVAPDLIGQGHSGKEPRHQYHFRDHYKYLSEWIEKMRFTGKINLVIHDWGSGLGFHWANKHRNLVESITFMEALTGPVVGWDQFPEIARRPFQNLRGSGGEEMVLKKNFFVERLLPGAILRDLSEEEMNEYRLPFKEPGESRRPTLTWPREIPIKGEGPEDVIKIMNDYSTWLSTSRDLPKLYIDAEPGFFAPFIRKAIADWPNVTTAKAPGSHFLQEDSPDEIGQAIKDFLVKNVI